MIRELKIAAKYLSRLQIHEPPIDVRKIARELFKIERDYLPADVDAIILQDTRSSKPTLLLDKRLHENRERFTLAHEIGHVVLPWHIGTIACHTGQRTALVAGLYHFQKTEREANGFASELLVPTAWLRKTWVEDMEIEDLFRAVQGAQVSPHVALLAISRAAAPGLVLALLEPDETVVLSAQSEGTRTQRLQWGVKLDASGLDKFAVSSGEFDCGYLSVKWWFLPENRGLPEETMPFTSRQLLLTILNDIGLPDREASINGIVGSAFVASKHKTYEDLFSAIINRFVNRVEYSEFREHEYFQQFAKQKAIEIIDRRLKHR